MLKLRTPFGALKGHVRMKNSQANRNTGKIKPIKKDETSTSKIRNIGIMAHIDAGKTTTTERFLYYSGFINNLGDVDKGDTVTDYMEQERARGITITSAAVSFFWNQHRINLIDTPGHVDFTLEVERSLRVLDGAVAVMDASKGVEAQTLTVWRQADRYNVPRIIYLNKMDKGNADFFDAIDTIHDKLHIRPLVIQLPLGQRKEFKGIIDVITLQKYVWDDADHEGSTYSVIPLNNKNEPSLYEEAYDARNKVIDRLADLNDNIADHILNDVDYMDIPNIDIVRALRKATVYQNEVPLLCGSSFKNKGVQPLLNSIVNFLPNPTERTHNFVEYYKDTLCALAFKTVFNKYYGPVTFVRIYSGSLTAESTIFNINHDHRETAEKLFQVYADEYQIIRESGPGNIVAVTGLKETATGDTLVESQRRANAATRAWLKAEGATIKQPKAETTQPKADLDEEDDGYGSDSDEETLSAPVLAGMQLPDPVFLCTVEAPTLSQQKALDAALENLTREDPSLRVQVDDDTGQTILSGMGELHLEVICERIRTEYKVDVELGPLIISYRESLQAPATASMQIDRLIGTQRHRVNMTLTVLPDENDEQKLVDIRLHEDSQTVPGKLKLKTLKAITSGAKSALNRGPLLHFPVLGARVELNDYSGKFGTSPAMISACAAKCVSEALKTASTRLLQPMMKLEVLTDEDYVDAVTTELMRRGGQIEDIQRRGQLRTVHASTPLARITDLSRTMRSLTSGTASFSMEISHYEYMSQHETDETVQKVMGFRPIRAV